MRDFLPTASLEMIRLRAALLKKLRGFFDERDFVEVTTPVLSSDTVIDEHLDPLTSLVFDDPRQPDQGKLRYLQTSPEFHMKRLVAAGMQQIYQIGPAFRGGESGSHHNTEFTMVEWYRVGDDMQAGMGLLAELAMTTFDIERVERRSYSESFGVVGTDPHRATREELLSLCQTIRPDSSGADSRDDCLNLLWSHYVEPTLGREQPVIIYDYPASQAALARVRANSSGVQVAERFELYYRGIELANGYHELTDAAELRKRNTVINATRVASGKHRLPEDSRLLDAMESGFPACAGVALGFDRLVMVAARKNKLEQVMPFIDRNA